MYELGLRPRNSFLGIFVFNFRYCVLQPEVRCVECGLHWAVLRSILQMVLCQFKSPDLVRQKQVMHRKKRFTSFPSPAGMSLNKLPLGRNNSVMTSLFPPRDSLVVASRLGKGNSRTFFLRCWDNRYQKLGSDAPMCMTGNVLVRLRPLPPAHSQRRCLGTWLSSLSGLYPDKSQANCTTFIPFLSGQTVSLMKIADGFTNCWVMTLGWT